MSETFSRNQHPDFNVGPDSCHRGVSVNVDLRCGQDRLAGQRKHVAASEAQPTTLAVIWRASRRVPGPVARL